ncbi:small cysteine-rich protein 3-like [Acropora palmata]|uniref:small cysteine-rich protein 3-like n=1 Tax=Acropora palmata TaxID=6131 RepID=UPI003DA07F47
MGVKLNICLLVLLVATICSQGFNLRKKDDSKDDNPFGIDRGRNPLNRCRYERGYCTPPRRPCRPGFRACPDSPGYRGVLTCCCL